MNQTIHELNDGWTVYTPLGKGTALLVTTSTYLTNSVIYVKLQDGQLKHFDSNDIRLEGSPTYGETLLPNIPETWKK